MRGNVRVHQAKIRAKKRKRFALISSAVVLLVLIVLGGFAWLSRAEFLKITEVRVTGSMRLSEEFVASSTSALLAGNYLGLFSRSAVFLYPHDAIEREFSAMPVVKEVKVSSRGLKAIEVAISERVEMARFCDGSAGEFAQCLALDEDGLAFFPSSDDSMIAYRSATTSLALGDSLFAQASDFKGIQFFLRELSSLDLNPREAIMGEAGYMTVTLGGGGRLIVNSTDDLSGVLANLSSILRDRSVAPSLGDFLARLDYMRLDSGNKVFYKFR
jgi:hypothetical protein